jgi:hypothetical protein
VGSVRRWLQLLHPLTDLPDRGCKGIAHATLGPTL